MTKSCLLTGGSGFLGTYILKELNFNGYDVYSVGRSNPSDIKSHVQWNCKERAEILDKSYSKVIHVAGMAHISHKQNNDGLFYQVNKLGTENLLVSLDKLSIKPKELIFISTVAVYGRNSGELISENIKPKPYSAYGKSKYLAEKLVLNWCKNNKCRYIILRLPLVVGTNPPGNLGLMIRAIKKSCYVKFDGNEARKSAVLAEDVSKLVCKSYLRQGVFNLTDGCDPYFRDIENAIEIRFGKINMVKIPFILLFYIAKVMDALGTLTGKELPFSSKKLNKMTQTLTFSIVKAQELLDWRPQPVVPYIKKCI